VAESRLINVWKQNHLEWLSPGHQFVVFALKLALCLAFTAYDLGSHEPALGPSIVPSVSASFDASLVYQLHLDPCDQANQHRFDFGCSTADSRMPSHFARATQSCLTRLHLEVLSAVFAE
jgi:hypothetical protein